MDAKELQVSDARGSQKLKHFAAYDVIESNIRTIIDLRLILGSTF